MGLRGVRVGFFLLSVFFAAEIFAASGPETLLASERRPTVRELREALAPWPDRNPFSGRRSRVTDDYRRAGLAKLIAQLETAFPGATWAPLGRDCVMLGDFLDLFYSSVGMEGRVKRLDGSSATIRGATREELVGFLKGAGYDVLRAKELPPFILLDSTWYRDTSQSVRILQAAYETYAENGGDPSDLVGRLSAVNLYPDGGIPIDAKFDRESTLRQAAENVKNRGYPTPIPSVSPAPENGVLSYTTEWHDTFGKLRLVGDGIWRAQVPPPNSFEQRSQILYELFTLAVELPRSSLREEVVEAARLLGRDLTALPCTVAISAVTRP